MNKNMAKTVLGLCCYLSISMASAATIAVGALNPGDLYVNSPTVPAGNFADTYNFQLTAGSDSALTATSLELAGFFSISGLQLQLFDAPNGGGSLLGNNLSLNLPLSAGAYSAEVSGTATGSSGGLYSFALTVAPVPIPAAVWLLGSGLVGLVVVGRRGDGCRMAAPEAESATAVEAML